MSGNTQSGREAARAYRQGQKIGKAKIAQLTRTSSKVSAKATSPATTPAPAAKSPVRRPATTAAAPVAVAAGRQAAKQARQQQKTGKVSRTQSTPNPHPKAKARMKQQEPVVQPRQKVATNSASKQRTTDRKIQSKSAPIVQSGGRNASKAFRKAGSKGKAAQAAFKSKGTQSGAVAKMVDPSASTRDIARKIRTERCTKGKRGCVPTESSSTKRRQAKASRPGVPKKVEESRTLSGQTVTGVHVGQGRKVLTGAETGACQLVSGTEYLGTEEFEGTCDVKPTANPSKVTFTQTTRGQVVSGTEVGKSETVTGDEPGLCSAVTGTEYIPADQSKLFCGTEGAINKSAQTAFSVMSQPSQPTQGGSKVTGGENYKSQSVTIRPQKAPEKVVESKTAMGTLTTGTQVGRIAEVTGVESGACRNVTGTGYQSHEEAEVCGIEPEKPPVKVMSSATTSGQKVTGDRSGATFDITGGEAGSCQAVTGTGYMGAEQLAVCPTEQQSKIVERQRANSNPVISGVQPGPQGLTGAQKGACKLVSGTHYQGVDQTSMVCDVADTANAAMPGQSDFPQMMTTQAPVAAEPQEQLQKGTVITGDGWDRGTKVTGTEGPWAAQRNASIRGSNRQAPMSAAQFRPASMEEVPQSPITGSAGNTNVGAKVTLSGGARA